VERGLFGLIVLLALFVVPVVWAVSRPAIGRSPPLAAGALAALVAFAAVAAVDEPLNRPAEAMLLWTAIAILVGSLGNHATNSPSC
jgi:hypothetical protein